MSDGTRSKPVVVVMGTTAEEPPPGIDAIAGDVELRYAPDRASLEREIADAEIVYTWWGEREDLEAVWPRASNVKWVAASNVGINRLLFPALVESDVPLTQRARRRGRAHRRDRGRVRGRDGEGVPFDVRSATRALVGAPSDGTAGGAPGPHRGSRADRPGDRPRAPRRARDADRGGGAHRACRRRPVRDRPRRRRAACGARRRRLRDRHHAVDAADAPHVRRGGVRRHEDRRRGS